MALRTDKAASSHSKAQGEAAAEVLHIGFILGVKQRTCHQCLAALIVAQAQQGVVINGVQLTVTHCLDALVVADVPQLRGGTWSVVKCDRSYAAVIQVRRCHGMDL